LTKDHVPAPRLSAGVVVVRQHGGAWRYLLLRAFRYWDFPKGAVEAGESPRAAAVREVAEEAGLAALEFRWGDVCCETEPYGRGKVARYYVADSPAGDVHLPVSPELGRPEHHEYRWLGYRAARVLLVPRVQRVLDWAESIVAAAR
jgi:bis(5'-nucleosidyl)-tetraphosphatase